MSVSQQPGSKQVTTVGLYKAVSITLFSSCGPACSTDKRKLDVIVFTPSTKVKLESSEHKVLSCSVRKELLLLMLDKKNHVLKAVGYNVRLCRAKCRTNCSIMLRQSLSLYGMACRILLTNVSSHIFLCSSLTSFMPVSPVFFSWKF